MKETKKKYYHFAHNRVFVFGTPAKNFEALTKQQSAFYEQCQNEGYSPTLDEVRNCNKTVIPFDLAAYKQMLIEKCSGISFSESERAFPPYRHKDAVLNVYKNSSELLENESKMVVRLRKEFYGLKESILLATTKEEIDVIYSTAKFAEISNSYDFTTVDYE